MCLKIYKLDPEKLLSASGLRWQATLTTDIDMLLMVEKGIRRGNVTLFIDLHKLITNT